VDGDEPRIRSSCRRRALEDTLRWFEKCKIRYHLVAHSHRGNVVLRALNFLPRDPKHLGTVVFLGTPFLDFGEHRELKFLFRRRFPLILHLLAFALSLLAVFATRYHWLALGCTLVTGLAAFLEAGRVFFKDPLEKRKRSSLYGSGRPHAFAFASDETIGGLTQTVNIMGQPRKYVAQLDRNVSRGFAVTPTRSYSEYKFTETWPMLTLKRDGSNRSWDRQSVLLMPFGILVVLTAIFGLIPEVLILLAHWVPRTWSSVQSKISRWLSREPGAILAGRVVRDSVVGADEGRFQAVSHLPPGVQQLEPISAELNERMSAVAQQFTSAVGDGLHAGLTFGPEDDLKKNVLSYLSDRRLAHSQYYQEQEIIERAAALIAGVSQAAANAAK
jgi:hypothetical protein